NAYVFERAVRFRHDDGTTSPGRIDLYKKGCFVLEAKPSKKREKGGEVYEQVAFALETGDREEDERISAEAAFELGALAERFRDPAGSEWTLSVALADAGAIMLTRGV